MSENFKKTIILFGERTTLHGIAFTTNTKFASFRKLLWTVIIVFIYAGFIAIFWNFMHEYLEYNYVERTKIVDAIEQRLPAITFCNVNWFSRSLLTRHYPVTDALIHANFNNISFTEVFSRFPQEQIDAEINVKYHHLVLNTSYRVEDFLVSCKLDYRMPAHSCEPYVSLQVTDQGFCYTVHSQEVIDDQGAIYKHFEGMTASLVVTINVHPDDYYFTEISGQGVRMRVHSPEVFPYMDSNCFFISPGTTTAFGLQRVDMERLPKPYTSGCSASPGYSQDACLLSCMVERYYLEVCEARCSVTSPHGCTFMQVITCANDYLATQRACRCEPKCEETTYTVGVSTMKFPNQAAVTDTVFLGWPTNDTQELAANFAEVYVYFESLDTEKTAQVPVLPFTTMLSNTGGIIGLFIGASVVSVVELVQLFVDLLRLLVLKIRGKKAPRSNFVKVKPALSKQEKDVPVYIE